MDSSVSELLKCYMLPNGIMPLQKEVTIVFVGEKFQPHLIETKPKLLRLVLVWQEFGIEIMEKPDSDMHLIREEFLEELLFWIQFTFVCRFHKLIVKCIQQEVDSILLCCCIGQN